MLKKYYAVRKGIVPGIYETWEECKANVTGYTGAEYKSFKNLEEAELFIEKKEKDTNVDVTENIYSFVDGSFNPETNVYGCGGFLVVNGERYVLQASSSDTEMAEMRNVAGEILGSTLAIKKAIELGLPEITIYYDYFGIEKWATNEWKANKEGTKKYKSFIEESRKKIKINFKKVAGHSGIDGNEEADKLAKQAVGVK